MASAVVEQLVKAWEENTATGGDPDFSQFVHDYFTYDNELTDFLDSLGGKELRYVLGDDLKTTIVNAIDELARDPEMLGDLAVNASVKKTAKYIKVAGTIYEKIPQYIRVKGSLYRLADGTKTPLLDAVKKLDASALFDADGFFVPDTGDKLDSWNSGPGQSFGSIYEGIKLSDAYEGDDARGPDSDVGKAEKYVETVLNPAMIKVQQDRGQAEEGPFTRFDEIAGDEKDGWYLTVVEFGLDV